MNVFCFDFDGVVCDSAPETGFSAWKGCRALWPGIGADWSQALQERFCRLRPVMQTGFEAIPLMRLILDGEVSDDRLFAEFPALRDGLVAREGLSTKRLQEVFGAMRDAMIAEDEAAWLCWNRFYPGLREILLAAIARHALFIITTKQERFVMLLCRDNGIELPAERVFGLEQGLSKPEVLKALRARPEWNGAAFHFIEDRLETLVDVIGEPALAAVKLYLADWGYNTPAQRKEAAEISRIRVVSPEALRQAIA